MKQAKRTSWAYCPQCRRDLNGDNESFVDDTEIGVRFTCAFSERMGEY